MSSDGEEEEEDDSPSLSPSSSHSCSRAEHSAPQSDSSAPGSLPLQGANFLSATPAQWSVDEVCRFISSLQGWCLEGERLRLLLGPTPRVLQVRPQGQVFFSSSSLSLQAARNWLLSSCRRKSMDRRSCCCGRTTSSPP